MVLGQDSGNIRWHLRQLAEHGFIAEDSARGTRRERWWHALHDTSQLDVAELPAADGPATVHPTPRSTHRQPSRPTGPAATPPWKPSAHIVSTSPADSTARA
jgi:hypothetical protein